VRRDLSSGIARASVLTPERPSFGSPTGGSIEHWASRDDFSSLQRTVTAVHEQEEK